MPLLPAETEPGLKLSPEFTKTRGQEWILGSSFPQRQSVLIEGQGQATKK